MREYHTEGGKIVHMPDTVQRKPDDGHQCECHAKMGNEFWFLPTGSCLRTDKTCDNGGRQ